MNIFVHNSTKSILKSVYSYINNNFNNTFHFFYNLPSKYISDNNICIYEYIVSEADIDDNILYINMNMELLIYKKNILNLHVHLDLIDFDIKDINDTNEKQLIYISNVIYNFIRINTNLITDYPIVLDPVSSIIELINNNKSYIRFGDGELRIIKKGKFSSWHPGSVLKDKELYSNLFKELAKNKKKNILMGICDVYNESYRKIWNERDGNFWYLGKHGKRWLDATDLSMSNFYGSCFIGRIRNYTIFNKSKILKLFSTILLNKINIIICAKDTIKCRIDQGLFISKKNIFVLCNHQHGKEGNTINNENTIDDLVTTTRKLCKKYNANCYVHMGFYAKKICYDLAKHNIKCIDLGTWSYDRLILNKHELCKIDNIVSLSYLVDNSGKLKTDLPHWSHNNTNEFLIIEENVDFKIKQNNSIISDYESVYIKFINIKKNPKMKIRFFTYNIIEESYRLKCKVYIECSSLFDLNIDNKVINCKTKVYEDVIEISSFKDLFIVVLNIDQLNEFIIKNMSIRIISCIN